jgi:hypothetical protein
MEDEEMEAFDWFINKTNPNYEYERAQKIVQGDKRINKPLRYSDIEESAKDTIEWQNSDLGKQTTHAKYLLEGAGEIGNEELKNTLKKYYNVSDKGYDQILHSLANDADCNVRLSPFTKEIRIEKIK